MLEKIEGKHRLNLNMMGERTTVILTQSRTQTSLVFTSWGHSKDSVAGNAVVPFIKDIMHHHACISISYVKENNRGLVASLSIGLKPITMPVDLFVIIASCERYKSLESQGYISWSAAALVSVSYTERELAMIYQWPCALE